MSLLEQIQKNQKKIFLQFGGQGSPYLKEISKLYKEEPVLKDYFEVVFKTLKNYESVFPKTDKRFEFGFDLKSWIENQDSAPPEDYQARASISVIMIFLTQMAHYHLWTQKGYSPKQIKQFVAGTTGHSQGIIAASFASLNLEKIEFLKALENYIGYMFYLAYHAQGAFMEFEYSKEVYDGNQANGDKSPAPMVAVIGYTKEELEQRVEIVNQKYNLNGKTKIYVSLYNTPDSMILSARPESLLLFRNEFKQEMDESKKKFVYLKTSAPFHCPFMENTWEGFKKDLDSGKFQFPYQISDLQFAVYSIFDGEDYRNKQVSLAEILYKDVVIRPLFWDKALGLLFTANDCEAVIDFGPSVVSSRLTTGQLISKNISIPVYCLANPKDLKTLFE